MCYQNCKYENFDGDCRKPRYKICPDVLEERERENEIKEDEEGEENV